MGWPNASIGIFSELQPCSRPALTTSNGACSTEQCQMLLEALKWAVMPERGNVKVLALMVQSTHRLRGTQLKRRAGPTSPTVSPSTRSKRPQTRARRLGRISMLLMISSSSLFPTHTTNAPLSCKISYRYARGASSLSPVYVVTLPRAGWHWPRPVT